MRRSERARAIQGFGIDRVAAAADEPRASARWPVLRLENLDTDLPLPPGVLETTARALSTPKANSWLPFQGDHDLRAAISDFTHERTGHRYDPESEIVVTCGGMEGLLDVLLALVDPGDEVVLTDPIYAGLVNRVRLCGGVPRLVPLRVEDGEWRFDAEAFVGAIGERTAALLLMSPSMPTGCVLTEEDWRAVCEACVERQVPLVYDAAMERLLFDGRPLVHPARLPGMTGLTAIVGSLSKEHRMIGWRVGWICGPPQLVADAGWAHVYNTTTPVGLSRAAGVVALRGEQEHVGECVAELERRRDAVLAALPGWPLVRPGGGWSLLLDVDAIGFSAPEASRLLLEESAVAATAMVGWGGEVAERHVRLVFSAEPVERLATLAERVAGTRLGRATRERR
jgi:aspartate/methionine/tyrosine aminotransferase